MSTKSPKSPDPIGTETQRVKRRDERIAQREAARAASLRRRARRHQRHLRVRAALGGARSEIVVAGPELRRPVPLDRFELSGQMDALEDALFGADGGRWPHVGLRCRFPLLSEHLNGFRNSLYVLAGACRMGKTSFALQLLLDLLALHPEAHGVYVSLDQPARDLNLRMVAQAGDVSMDYLVNPSRERMEDCEEGKERGLRLMRHLSSRLHVIDESWGGLSTADVEEIVKRKRRETDGPLFVAIDPVYELRVSVPTYSLDERVAAVARELKTLCTAHDVGFLVTTRLASAAGERRPEMVDLEEQASLLYAADVIALIYCDYLNNGDTVFLEWEWGTEDLMVPVFELDLVKNKMAAFSGRLYYRFYNSKSKFAECSALEGENYDRMLLNLQSHAGEDVAGDVSVTPRVEDATAIPQTPRRPRGGASPGESE